MRANKKQKIECDAHKNSRPVDIQTPRLAKEGHIDVPRRTFEAGNACDQVFGIEVLFSGKDMTKMTKMTWFEDVVYRLRTLLKSF